MYVFRGDVSIGRCARPSSFQLLFCGFLLLPTLFVDRLLHAPIVYRFHWLSEPVVQHCCDVLGHHAAQPTNFRACFYLFEVLVHYRQVACWLLLVSIRKKPLAVAMRFYVVLGPTPVVIYSVRQGLSAGSGVPWRRLQLAKSVSADHSIALKFSRSFPIVQQILVDVAQGSGLHQLALGVVVIQKQPHLLTSERLHHARHAE